jgi:hypothetical protein
MDQRWLALGIAVALGACGTDEDSRPPTLEVVTLTVLAPSCGQPQCHSTTTRTQNLAFDTVEEANASLLDLEVDLAVGANRPLENDLWNVITANDKQRMPPDAPLAGQDITLIHDFLLAGAPGLEAQ